MNIILTIICVALTLLAISLKKTYQLVPPKELKRRAREGDEFAALLYKAVGYGYSLQGILWIIVGLAAAGFFVVVTREMPAWFAFVVSAVLIWLGFFWVPTGRVTSLGLRLAGWLAPAFGWLLNYLHPIFDRIVSFVGKYRHMQIHTGLYDKTDLLLLLEQQQVQADNRIEKTELSIAQHALTFGDKYVRDIMTPRRIVKTVGAHDPVGPVLMTELHDSGYSRFPVYDGEHDNIVGTLYLRDATSAKAGGIVRDSMRSNDVCYLHEDQPLTEALDAILKTRRHLMIVVNSFEEYVGIVTIEDVLEQVVGSPIVDEFDQYDDLRAVAAKMAKADHKKHTDHREPVQDSTEVVE